MLRVEMTKTEQQNRIFDFVIFSITSTGPINRSLWPVTMAKWDTLMWAAL